MGATRTSSFVITPALGAGRDRGMVLTAVVPEEPA